MEDVLIPAIVCLILFVGLPWIVLHHITKWKTAATLTTEDENLLDDLHDLARRLDERMATIERIVQAENPNWRAVAVDPVDAALEDRSSRMLETDSFEPRPRSNRASRRNA